MPGVFAQEAPNSFGRAVQNNFNVVIAGGPGIVQKSRSLLLKQRGGVVPQTVESHAQRTPPLLVPSLTAKIAAAVCLPPANAMHTAPGGVFDDMDFMARRELLQKLAIVGEARDTFGLDLLQRIGQGHLAILVMMSVSFAIGSDVDQLRPRAFCREPAPQAIHKVMAVVQQLFKRNRLGDRAVIEKKADFLPR